MPEQEDPTTLQERVERIERKLEELAQRVERIEQRTSSPPHPKPRHLRKRLPPSWSSPRRR